MSACLGHVLQMLPGVIGPGTRGPLVQFPPDPKSASRVLILTVELGTL